MTSHTVRREGVRCTRCGARYDRAGFRALTPVQTLRDDEISTIATGWPPGVVVDVRACASCTSPIARLEIE